MAAKMANYRSSSSSSESLLYVTANYRQLFFVMRNIWKTVLDS